MIMGHRSSPSQKRYSGLSAQVVSTRDAMIIEREIGAKRAKAETERTVSTPTAGLGDIICLEGDCAIGEKLVRQMANTFASITDAAVIAKYKPAVDGIVKSFREIDSSFSRKIPFSPDCCAIKELGRNAQELTRQMLADVGAAVPGRTISPEPPKGLDIGGAVSGALKFAAWGAVLFGAGIGTYYVVRAVREQIKPRLTT